MEISNTIALLSSGCVDQMDLGLEAAKRLGWNICAVERELAEVLACIGRPIASHFRANLRNHPRLVPHLGWHCGGHPRICLFRLSLEEHRWVSINPSPPWVDVAKCAVWNSLGSFSSWSELCSFVAREQGIPRLSQFDFDVSISDLAEIYAHSDSLMGEVGAVLSDRILKDIEPLGILICGLYRDYAFQCNDTELWICTAEKMEHGCEKV